MHAAISQKSRMLSSELNPRPPVFLQGILQEFWLVAYFVGLKVEGITSAKDLHL